MKYYYAFWGCSSAGEHLVRNEGVRGFKSLHLHQINQWLTEHFHSLEFADYEVNAGLVLIVRGFLSPQWSLDAY